MGFKKRRKEELLDALCQAYASADAPPRVYRCLAGAPRWSRAQELFVQLALCTASGEAARSRTSRDGSLSGEELSVGVEDS